MSINQALKTQRQLASSASGGISNEAVYSAFEQVLIQLDLKGEILDFGAGTGTLIQGIQVLERFSSLTAIDLMLRADAIDEPIEGVFLKFLGLTGKLFPEECLKDFVTAITY